MTPEWLEKQRRDLTWENLMLISHLMQGGQEFRARRLKGSRRSAELKTIRRANILVVGKGCCMMVKMNALSDRSMP